MDKDCELARVIMDHSLRVKPKEKVLIIAADAGLSLAKAVFGETLKRGAYPILDVEVAGYSYTYFQEANEWQLKYVPKTVIETKLKWADAYVRIATEDSGLELAGIEPKKISLRSKLMQPYKDLMVDSGRWVLTFYPTVGMAKQAKMSLPDLYKHYYEACLVDYGMMAKKLKGLEKLLDRGEEIRIIGKKTDLKVKIKGRLAQACCGECNLPDGEVFLAPQTSGVNGHIYLDLPTLAYGREVNGVYLEFHDGKVVFATADIGNDELQKMLVTDAGASRVGEFAIGTNDQIKQAMRSTIFDEKIGGTIHMALGRAFKDKRGGGENRSTIHWDIVKDMRLPGSVLTIDGKVVLKDGKLLV
ncbi:MAG: peptidase M29 aminopeptidase II [uncultured bacterium]|nr:MAG: peptidase M29 aminopeptidase II [uncultured bacterium]